MQRVLTPSVLFLIGSAGIRDIERLNTLPLRKLDHEKMNRKIRPSPMSLSGLGYAFGGESLVMDLGIETSIVADTDTMSSGN